MPPPANPGSRGGLITAVVIFAILFVTSTIFAIYYGTQAAKTERDLEEVRQTIIPDIVRDPSRSSPILAPLVEVRRQAALPGVQPSTPLIEVAIAQRDQLARTIAGPSADPLTVEERAASALQTIAQQTEVSLPSSNDNLIGALTTLGKAYASTREQLATTQSTLEATRKELADAAAANEAEIAAMQQQIEQVRAEAQKRIQEITAASQASRESLQAVEQAREDERARAQEAVEQLNVQLAQLRQERGELAKQLEAVQRKLASYRVDVNEPLMRQADGQIISVPGNNTVYIDLGSGDQVVPGLTFEVYDRVEGMPRTTATTPTGDPILPQGKASIEVVRVGGTSSEARIVRQQTGTILQQGDIIANLVYDPNTRYRFMVYGKFDLDNNDVATAADTEVIKRLITQWGGRLVDEVTVNTDFVVLGAEPQIPEFTSEELRDPLNFARMEQAQQELDAYLDVVQRARELSIPILNQNRFLYFIGYFDQARR